MNIICTVCVGKLSVPEWVDTKDYEGQISCKGCRTIWDVVFRDDKLQYFHPSESLMDAEWGIPKAFMEVE